MNFYIIGVILLIIAVFCFWRFRSNANIALPLVLAFGLLGAASFVIWASALDSESEALGRFTLALVTVFVIFGTGFIFRNSKMLKG